MLDWEAGTSAPTYPQLEQLAYDVYKRPLAVFFLPAPPTEATARQEFRTLPAEDLADLSRDTLLKVRSARAYQLALAELYNNINPAPIRAWERIQLHIGADVTVKAADIRALLGVDLAVQAGWGSDDEALRGWRAAVERVGVFVFKNSFKQASISGFCLRDHAFPVIYLNNSTTKTRQIFSLLHEFAHVLFNVNGISKFDHGYIEHLPARERALEVFCNVVAAEVLIPTSAFDQATAHLPSLVDQLPDSAFITIAHTFGVSREAILRRFLDRGRTTGAFYEEKSAEWTRQMTKKEGGGNYYATQGAYISDSLLNEVFSRRLRGQMSSEQAAEYLGVRGSSLPGLEELVLQRKRN